MHKRTDCNELGLQYLSSIDPIAIDMILKAGIVAGGLET